jgi:hypothetical protein
MLHHSLTSVVNGVLGLTFVKFENHNQRIMIRISICKYHNNWHRLDLLNSFTMNGSIIMVFKCRNRINMR